MRLGFRALTSRGVPLLRLRDVDGGAVRSARTIAVMLEPVQGEGGVVVPAADYMHRVRELCDRRGFS